MSGVCRCSRRVRTRRSPAGRRPQLRGYSTRTMPCGGPAACRASRSTVTRGDRAGRSHCRRDAALAAAGRALPRVSVSQWASRAHIGRRDRRAVKEDGRTCDSLTEATVVTAATARPYRVRVERAGTVMRRCAAVVAGISASSRRSLRPVARDPAHRLPTRRRGRGDAFGRAPPPYGQPWIARTLRG